MSYTILYGRQFIKVDDNHVIVMVEQGDNNVWEGDNKRRARDWSNSYAHSDAAIIVANNKLLANIDTFRQTTMEGCEDYSDKKWGYFAGVALYGKSTRNTTFGAYRRFYEKGIKEAMSIEELVNSGVRVKIGISYWGCKKMQEKGLEVKPDVWFSSTEQMVEKIKEYTEYYKGVATVYLIPYNIDHVLRNRRYDLRVAKFMRRKEKERIARKKFDANVL